MKISMNFKQQLSQGEECEHILLQEWRLKNHLKFSDAQIEQVVHLNKIFEWADRCHWKLLRSSSKSTLHFYTLSVAQHV